MRLAGIIAGLVVSGGLLVRADQASAQDQQQLLAKARDWALTYINALPDFTCTESVQRTERIGPRGLNTDKLAVQLAYSGHKEHHKLISINGKSTDQPIASIEGLISGGEFGTLLLQLFDPSSAANFEWKEWSNLRKHRTAVFTYRVPRAQSHYVVGYRGADGNMISASAGYRGEVVVDSDIEPGRVLHLTTDADDIPKESAILRSFMSVDYDYVTIAGRKYTLPVHSESGLGRPNRDLQSVVKFGDYRKFEVDSTIDFGAGDSSTAPKKK